MGLAVEYSEDFARIQALPVREVLRARGEELARELTPHLVTERGRTHSARKVRGRVVELAEPSRLNWLQAYAIHEAAERGGAYLQLPVGTGKTLLTFLLPFVFDAKRPVLVVPESLIDKTHAEFRQYQAHWIRHGAPLRVIGLRALTQDSNVNELRNYKSDLYLLDEVDLLSNQNSSMAKRLARDIDARGVRTVAMTGTGGRFSILNFSHLITWALKEDAPVPLGARQDGSREVETWADALDEKQGEWSARSRRVLPGALLDLIPVNDQDDPEIGQLTELGLARITFRKRLLQTEGCIISDEDSCDKQLSIALDTVPHDPTLERAFKDFRIGRLPNGEILDEPLRIWSQARCLGLGYFEEWIEPPPEWWDNPRKLYFKLCNRVILRTAWTGKPLDTRRAVHREFPNHPIVLAWEEVKDQWEGETRPVWLSASVVEDCADWAVSRHGLLWTTSVPFGEAVGDASGLPFYGAKGLTIAGDDIEVDAGHTSVVLSAGSNMRGRNLQDRWHSNCIAGDIQSARYKEQLLGRTHRFGQEADVDALILLTSGDSLYSFERSILEARFVHATQGHRQKLLRASITPPTTEHRRAMLRPNQSRWVSKPAA